MRRKVSFWRRVSPLLFAALFLGSMGNLSLAKDAFDEEFTDCPAWTRLDAVSGLTVDFTDQADEIRISWDALDPRTLETRLGPNMHRATLTLIVEGGGNEEPIRLSLGDTSEVINGLPHTQPLLVSLSLTQGRKVISDIAETEFVTGMPAPSYSTQMKLADGEGGTVGSFKTESQVNTFYFLGFNTLFDNWYVGSPPIDINPFIISPSSQKFHIGLRHGKEGLDTEKIDFTHYRISVEDSNGDQLGFQPETIEAANTYSYDHGTHAIVFGQNQTLVEGRHLDDGRGIFPDLTNIRLSTGVRTRNPVSPYYAKQLGFYIYNPDYDRQNDFTPRYGLSFGNHLDIEGMDGSPVREPVEDAVFAETPVEYYDFPPHVFTHDGNYTIKSWAENGNDYRISPQASITLNIQESQPTPSRYMGHQNGYRMWDFNGGEDVLGLELRVFHFSILDE